jgi:type I restriction enzyme M protein
LGVPASAGPGKSTLKRGHRTAPLGVHPSGCSGRTLKEAKAELRAKAREIKDGIKARLAEVKRAVKELGNLDEERTERLAEINAHADRQVAQVNEAAADLARICADPQEAKRYFVVAERAEIEENEFNLNLPRYVDTFEPEEYVRIPDALDRLKSAASEREGAARQLADLLTKFGIK